MTPEFIYTIKRAGVLEIARRYTELQKAGDYVYCGRCPNPDHRDSSPSFFVYLNRNTGGIESWCCQGCHVGRKNDKENFGSDNIAFVQWLSAHKKKPLSFKEAVKFIAKFYNIPMEVEKNRGAFDLNMILAESYNRNLFPDVKQYLFGRGLEQSDIDKWLIGFKTGGKYPMRITFPIMDVNKNVIGFSNREFLRQSDNSIAKRKYVNSDSSAYFNKKTVLYGSNFIDRSCKNIIITEGQFDVILGTKYGLPNVVGTLCCSLSQENIEFIKRTGMTPILCYDQDEAGQKGINRALRDLYNAGIRGSKILVLPEGKDLADTALLYKYNLMNYASMNIMTHSQLILTKIADSIDSKINGILQDAMPDIRHALDVVADPDELIVSKNFIQKRIRLWTT